MADAKKPPPDTDLEATQPLPTGGSPSSEAFAQTVTMVGSVPQPATPFTESMDDSPPPLAPVADHENLGGTIVLSPESKPGPAMPFSDPAVMKHLAAVPPEFLANIGKPAAPPPKELPDKAVAMARAMGIELPPIPDMTPVAPPTQQERSTGRSLAKLATANDKQIAKLTNKVVGPDSVLVAEDLQKMRDVLKMMADALETGDEGAQKKITAMWELISSN
jgi:hypothetical protein